MGTMMRKTGEEVIQEIVLCGLSQANFFRSSAFYGGTALRIFHNLDRFSEALDFSLREPNPDFDFSGYFSALEKEIRSYGLNFNIQSREKVKKSNIRSAFLEGNTREHLLLFYPGEQLSRSVGGNELIRIKFEVDTDPPAFATFETRYRLLPIPYEVTLYDRPSLFAGKIHAVLCRAWANRINGRDLYDYVFYLSRSTPVNLLHLTARLVQSGALPPETDLTIEDLKTMLKARFAAIDYSQARADVLPFIGDPGQLDIWSSEFFSSITEALQEQSGLNT